MPAKKNSALVKRHETNQEKADRVAGEMAVTPKTALTLKPPEMLGGHKIAAVRWKRLIELYSEVEGTLVTSFDEDLLANYCLIYEELRDDLPKLRAAMLKTYMRLDKRSQRVEDENLLVELSKQLTQMMKEIKALDARKDAKRALMLKLAQSSWLTPRSRLGVNPTEKEKPDTDDPMEDLLK
jgi:phage terminase small subunit